MRDTENSVVVDQNSFKSSDLTRQEKYEKNIKFHKK